MMPHGEQETDWERICFHQHVETFLSHAINLCTFYGLWWQTPVTLISCLSFKFLYMPEVTQRNSV